MWVPVPRGGEQVSTGYIYVCPNCQCAPSYAQSFYSLHVACSHSIGGPGGVVYECLACDKHCAPRMAVPA